MDRYFLVPWLSPPLAVLLLVGLAIVLVGSYAFGTRPSAVASTSAVRLWRHAALFILVIPLIVFIGFFLLLFPVGIPESLVLRSRAIPPIDPTPICFEADARELLTSRQAARPANCDGTSFEANARPVDAGPVVDLAIDLFFSGEQFSEEQLAERGTEVQAKLRRAVQQALETDPGALVSAPPPKESSQPRWLIEAIETAVVEGITLQRNIRNVLIERHVEDADLASADQWSRLRSELQKSTRAYAPGVRIEDGSRRGAKTFVSIIGQPWMQSTAGGAKLFVMLRRGPEEPKASLTLLTSNGAIVPTCDRGSADDLSNCLVDIDQWKPGASRLVVTSVAAPMGDPPYRLAVNVSDAAQSEVATVLDVSHLDKLRIAADPAVSRTLNCMFSGTDEFARSFVDIVSADSPQPVSVVAGKAGDVVIERQGDFLWVYPHDIRPDVQKSIVAAASLVPDPFRAEMQPAATLEGMMLFPYMTRSGSLRPGIASLADAPLAPTRSGPLSANADPSNLLESPLSSWINRYDAHPVLFTYAKDNFVTLGQKIIYKSIRPNGWRVDVVKGQTSDLPATVWLFSLDLDKQGLILEPGCGAARDLPKRGPADLSGHALSFEPQYDAARFVPFWASVVAAARTSASPDGELAFAAAAGPEHVPAILDDPQRILFHMRSARLGMLVVLAGLILHVGLLLLLRRRASPPRNRLVLRSRLTPPGAPRP